MEEQNGRCRLSPWDSFNQDLVAQVHPLDWVNPKPAPRYNLVVIGAGPAGLVMAAGAAGLGAKVALVEKHLIGGDCLNVGCVPSKALIRSSRAAAQIRDAQRYGVGVGGDITVDFGAVMQGVRSTRARISHHDSAKHFAALGVDVFLGEGQFTDADTFSINGIPLRFAKAAIATGARARTPAIAGIEEAGFLTNETVFNLTEGPRRLAVIGGGPIGCELAQAFQRLGTQVTLFHTHEHLLHREDADAAIIIQEQMKQDGVELALGCSPSRVEKHGDDKVVYYEGHGKEKSLVVDEILAGAGADAQCRES